MKRCLAAILLGLLALHTVAAQVEPWPREAENAAAARPYAPPREWLGLIGEYGPDAEPFYIFDHDERLWAIVGRGQAEPLEELSKGTIFQFAPGGVHARERVVFDLDSSGRATGVAVADVVYSRRQVGPETASGTLRVQPLRPVTELLKEAMTLQPPKESGDFRKPDLVELVKLDPTIKLDIRYATTNNFLGSAVYDEAQAFLQRPAAEALVRAQRELKGHGYGLLIYDGYRPWYVTKTFWDATPDDKKWIVADPSAGSRHNRGAAVDLTLYDLKTGRPVEMPSTYDETTSRAYAFYPGGTDIQRWHRALLRRSMESQSFTVNPQEWWHFDYQDWGSYAIGNIAFKDMNSQIPGVAR